MIPATLEALLSELIDYAGLFPPASLPMGVTVANFATYASSDRRSALGRLIIPAARLAECALETSRFDSGRWRLSAILGDDLCADASRIAAFNETPGGARVDAVEFRAESPAALHAAARAIDPSMTRFAEFAPERFRELAPALQEYAIAAKIRTGGVTASAFPKSSVLARFLTDAASAGVPFKATAGLHHPVRSVHPLTYEPDAPSGTMFGFVNVFVAAFLANRGADAAQITAAVDEADPGAFMFSDESLQWKAETIPLAEIISARRMFAKSFGSCSFREPIDDLTALGLL